MPRVILTASKSGFLRVRRNWLARRTGNALNVEQWELGRWRGLERLEGDGGNVVERYEPDSKPCALNFGFWFDEDMAACFTAFAALCAELGLGGAKVGGESWKMFLFRTLGGACGAGPALCAQLFYSGCIGRRVKDL